MKNIGSKRNNPNPTKREKIIEIFAASQGAEYAQESREWGHGAFTKAIFEGIIEGKAISHYEEHFVSNLSLFEWINYRVPQLTNNQQNPHRDGEGGSYILWQPLD